MSRLYNPKTSNGPSSTMTIKPSKQAWTDGSYESLYKQKTTPRTSPRVSPRATPLKINPLGQRPTIPRLNFRETPTPRDNASKVSDQLTPRYRQHQGGLHSSSVSPAQSVTPLSLRQYPVRELYYAKDSPKDVLGDTSSRGESRNEDQAPRIQRFNLRTLSVEKDEGGEINKISSTTLSSSATDGGSDDYDDQFNVALRVRPFNSQEKTRHDTFAVQFPGDGKVTVDNQGVVRSFYFNSVFEPDATQEDLFEQSGVIRLVDMALAGYACTALAFGQTGSGKTHTMTGPPQLFLDGLEPNPKMFGLIQRSFRYLYKQLKAIGTNKVLRASYLEVYNEQVIDLLNPTHRRYLAVRWSKNKGFYVENLFQVQCETLDDLMAVLEEGLRNRQTGSHGLNEFSSRSHSMLTVTIDSECPDPDDENLYITKRGKLSFVDLAGSEKVKDQNLGAGVMSESNSINKSLLVLGNCISHLGDSKRRQGHIPYRDSKLTKLLADSLGGNGVTLMITCITPSSFNATETMNTLRYASRAKKIKTKPTIKMDPREKLILSLKREIKILRNENHYLRQQLEFPAKPKGQLQKENDDKFMKFMKEQQQKESGLNEMLQEYMVENEALRGENSDLHSTRDKIHREQQFLYRENEKLIKRVEELERVVSQSPSTWQQVGLQHPQYEGYRQSDLISPRMSPSGIAPGIPPAGVPIVSPRKLSVPTRLPPQDFPYSDPSRLPGNSPRNAPPPGAHPHALRPPHRLSEPVLRAAPGPYEVVQNGGPYQDNSGIPVRTGRPVAPGPPNAHVRQVSPTRPLDRRVSQASNSDSIRDLNERLRQEVLDLEGEIQQQHQLTQRCPVPRQQQNGNVR